MPNIFKTFAYLEPECVSYSLIYQLFFRSTNLLLLLYLLLFIKSMTYSLAIHFLATFVYTSNRQNFGYDLSIKMKEK